jgi:hypothetical protein
VIGEPVVRDGEWRLLECAPAWDGNWTWDCVVAWSWHTPGAERLVVVNYADNQSQCYVRLPASDGGVRCFRDLMGSQEFERGGDDLDMRGLYLDLPPWGYHIFEIRSA